MLDCAIEMPEQIIQAEEAARTFHEGDIPLDRSSIHLVGLGGSAVAGELLTDMLSPRQVISIHRGINPPRDKRGVIVSSYSGNTSEVLELAGRVTGGLRTVVFMTSGGKLAYLSDEWSIPAWLIPTGYQPRAAIGWSLSLVLALMERWGVVNKVHEKLIKAARRLKASLDRDKLSDHILTRAALPIASALKDKKVVIFHSHQCTGAATRLAAQIAENGKQPAFPLVVPEAMHNVVQGIACDDKECWALIFMTDPGDPLSLRESMRSAMTYFTGLGFDCLPYPAAGDDAFELTLSRLFLADLVSLFLAALKGVDPTPISIITDLKMDIQSGDEPKGRGEDG